MQAYYYAYIYACVCKYIYVRIYKHSHMYMNKYESCGTQTKLIVHPMALCK